jgi:hypothetical protein
MRKLYSHIKRLHEFNKLKVIVVLAEKCPKSQLCCEEYYVAYFGKYS